jgi:hypothetical protein
MLPISVAIGNPTSQPTPGAVINIGTYRWWAPSRLSSRVSVAISSISNRLASTFPRHGSETARLSSSSRPATPNRSDIGHDLPNAVNIEWMRFFKLVRRRTRCRRDLASSRSRRISGSAARSPAPDPRKTAPRARARRSGSSCTPTARVSSPAAHRRSVHPTRAPRACRAPTRVPFIDSTTARTGQAGFFATRSASRRKPSPVRGACWTGPAGR